MSDPLATPVSRASTWNIANALTVLRLVLVPLFLLALFAHGGHDRSSRLLAFAVFAVASYTDRVDGQIARSRNLVTPFGKLVDPIADKALTGAALVGLSLLDDLPWWITVLVMTREIGVTLLRVWVIRHGVIPASRGGKLKTLLQGLAIGFYLLPLTGWAATGRAFLMGAAVAVTVVTGVDYVGRALTFRQTSERAAMKRARKAARTQ
jgi:CDP-diacylglycerol--glycerol-3-phosphate 3-phosphatidyltransferase